MHPHLPPPLPAVRRDRAPKIRSGKIRRLPAWLPVALAVAGVTVLAVRLLTMPVDRPSAIVAALVAGLAAIVVMLTMRGSLQRTRRLRLLATYPGSLVMPIVGNVDTSAATRWLAAKLRDPHLALRPERPGFLVVDAEGMRLSDGKATSAPLSASALSLLPLTTVKAGIRRADALVVGVTVGDTVVPLPLAPARTRAFAAHLPSDRDLLEVSARIEAALAGDPGDDDWDL